MSDRSVTPSDVHVQAIWNGEVVADSDDTIVVEGNHYFPPEAVKRDLLADSAEHTYCPWKGEASYYDIEIDGERNPGAVWYYPEPFPEAAAIKDYVAFWRGVEVGPAG
jgi:uncharacterized protein (DUF427 family)